METIRKIQLIELEILDEIVRMCNKYSLTYFLAYGTLIGAVRHKGFIPWDDDIDILMLREDYEKFLKIAESELSERFCLQYQKTEKNYWLAFAKVRCKNTIYEELKAPKNIKEKGFWVDILPLDYASVDDPKDIHRAKKIADITKILHMRRIMENGGSTSFRMRCFLNGIKWMGFNNRRLLNISNKTARSKSIGEYLVDFSQKNALKKAKPIDWFLPATTVEFEGKLYNAPCNWDAVLRRGYGDYMQLPPVEEREYHPAARIDFGPRWENKQRGVVR